MGLTEYIRGLFKDNITVKVILPGTDLNNVLMYNNPKYIKNVELLLDSNYTLNNSINSNKMIVVTKATTKDSGAKVTPWFLMHKLPSGDYIYESPRCAKSTGANVAGCALGGAERILIPPGYGIIVFCGGAQNTETIYMEYHEVDYR